MEGVAINWRRFGRLLLLWLAGSYVLGALPLLAHLAVGFETSLDPEWYLYLMVLSGAGAIDALWEEDAQGVIHMLVILVGLIEAAVGALGYSVLASELRSGGAENARLAHAIGPLLTMIALTYAFYKVPVLLQQARAARGIERKL